ncbi:enoyl-CoA hydratase-related protein [Clostridium sp. JN-1]|uniref:enoyl-CoA hydratase/isomerase family protein n=1 Tax=Clostridium sp. JN-1 TaxID=2483110 RepID=UPI000F0BBB4C|nr:enoyl-CoA hydratase-related protein [Clostridium sp. JN-1]
MIEEKSVLLEKENGIATVTMNRPRVLNTLHPNLITELVDTLNEVENDASIRVVILTGAGRAFCAGGDLPYINELKTAVDGRKYIRHASQIVSTITKMSKPVIGMVNGVAAGAGFNIALACDIVLCAKSARFAQSFSKVGLVPDCGGTYFLTKAVGLHKAKELMFTADLINSDTALQLGIVNQVIDDAELKEAAVKFAERLANSASIALALTKRILNLKESQELEYSLELEAGMQCVCLQTEDNKEGVKAFKEKRKPVFKGK